MKKISLLIVSAILLMVAVSSCSKENSSTPPDDVLIGNWRLTNVDFSVMPSTGRPTSDACIVELISGYDFKDNGKFYFVLNEVGSQYFPDPYTNDYWEWTGSKDEFSINQKNIKMPPYNFGLTPTNVKFEKSDNTWSMNFDADLSNGSKAHFKLIKEDFNKTQSPKLTNPKGEVYECNFFGQ